MQRINPASDSSVIREVFFCQNATQSGKPLARMHLGLNTYLAAERTTRRFACRGQNALAEARGGRRNVRGERQHGKFLVGNIGWDWRGMEGNMRERELAIWIIFGGGVNRPRFFWPPKKSTPSPPVLVTMCVMRSPVPRESLASIGVPRDWVVPREFRGCRGAG